MKSAAARFKRGYLRLISGAFFLQTVWKVGLCGFLCRVWRGRLQHDAHFWSPSLADVVVTAPPAPKNPTPVGAMAHRLKTPEGRDLFRLLPHILARQIVQRPTRGRLQIRIVIEVHSPSLL